MEDEDGYASFRLHLVLDGVEVLEGLRPHFGGEEDALAQLLAR